MPNASSIDGLPAVPKVAIFWFTPDLSGILCGSSFPVDEGELYGDCRIFPTSHFDHLEQLNREGFLRAACLSRVLRDELLRRPRWPRFLPHALKSLQGPRRFLASAPPC